MSSVSCGENWAKAKNLVDGLVTAWEVSAVYEVTSGGAKNAKKLRQDAQDALEIEIFRLCKSIAQAHASAPAIANTNAQSSVNYSVSQAETAIELLNQAACLMAERGKQYDKPQGERSMAATVTAFNAVTGLALTESHGWLPQAILKMVRDNQRQKPHRDSCEDFVAYSSLYAESRLRDPANG